MEFFIKKLSIEKCPGLNGFNSSGLEDLVLSPKEKGESGFIMFNLFNMHVVLIMFLALF